MKRAISFSLLTILSCNALAVSWQPISIAPTGTKLFLDNESILVNLDNPDEMFYSSRLESATDGQGLRKGELIVATEVINCSTKTKTLFSLKRYNSAGQLTYKSASDGMAINVVKVTPNTMYADVMNYVCQLNPKRPQLNSTNLELSVPKPNKNTWSFVSQDEFIFAQVDDMTIKANAQSGLVAFTSKLTSKSNETSFLNKGQYLIGQNIADCKKGTVARLFIAKFEPTGLKLAEERFSYNTLVFRIAGSSKISGEIQNYVCKAF